MRRGDRVASQELNTTSGEIAVLGSVNMDLVLQCERLPRPGETARATEFLEVCGGKGANQAVAAARLGSNVNMLAAVGTDAFADRLVDNFVDQRVGVDFVERMSGSSGVAVVAVQEDGENSILISSGANGLVTAEWVRQRRAAIASSDMLMLQLEIPIEAVIEATRIAKSAGVMVMLDPAPVVLPWPEELFQVDVLCPNVHEAASILGTPITNSSDAERAARTLVAKGCRTAVITMGDQGVVCCREAETICIPAIQTKVVDTTAAGDSFAGAFAVAWLRTGDLEGALRFACAAGSLAASRLGAQAGMGTWQEVQSLVDSMD